MHYITDQTRSAMRIPNKWKQDDFSPSMHCKCRFFKIIIDQLSTLHAGAHSSDTLQQPFFSIAFFFPTYQYTSCRSSPPRNKHTHGPYAQTEYSGKALLTLARMKLSYPGILALHSQPELYPANTEPSGIAMSLTTRAKSISRVAVPVFEEHIAYRHLQSWESQKETGSVNRSLRSVIVKMSSHFNWSNNCVKFWSFLWGLKIRLSPERSSRDRRWQEPQLMRMTKWTSLSGV